MNLKISLEYKFKIKKKYIFGDHYKISNEELNLSKNFPKEINYK